MELLTHYWAMLNDPTEPSNRVARKVAIFAVILICSLVYYRHTVIGFELGEPLLVTLLLSLMCLAVIGILGGVMAGSIYDAFLRDVGAKERNSTLAIFFAECLFALVAPILGLGMWIILSSHMP